jgi:hypothetical protein
MLEIAERRGRSLRHTYAGRLHDQRLGAEDDDPGPPGWVLLKDTGFQGLEPEQVSPYQPKKQPSNHARSAAEKAEHQMISRIRLLVEPVMSGGKRCRMVHDVLRKTKAPFDDLVLEIACG